MKYQIYFDDIDPDTGKLSQTYVVATGLDPGYAEALTKFLNEDEWWNNPNREHKFCPMNIIIEEWNQILESPKIGGEYNVVWNMKDNDYPLVTTMFYDIKTDKWTDTMNEGEEDMTKQLLYWRELPEPPKNIPKKFWSDEYIPPGALNSVYGKCQHDENMATCEICKSYQ